MSERVHLRRLSGGRSGSEYNLSFAGCGFLSVYYIGVISCIKRFAPQLYVNSTVSGASAGAVAGAFLICDVDQFNVTECFMDIINRSREYYLGVFDPRFHIMQYLKESVDRLLPHDAHIRCSGRLFISMTHQKSVKNRVVCHFKTREDLIRAILCSSFIPVFGGFNAPEYKGDCFIDGCFSDNLPNKNQNTITVSPFCGDANICPRDDIWEPSERTTIAGHIYLSQTSFILNWTNLKRVINIVVPMSSEDLCKLACSGFEDTLRFLLIRGIIACSIHRDPCLYNDHHRTGELESLPRRKGMTRITSTKPSKRPKSLSLPTIPKAVSSHMIKEASRNLLCELTNPTNKTFYHTTFGSRSLAVPECVSCRTAMLDSYVSQLPTNLYDIISCKKDRNNPARRHKQKVEGSLWWSCPSISMNILPEWIYPSSLTHQLLAQVLTLLTASASLQVSAVQSMISAFVEFIRRLPNSTASTLEPVVNLLTSFNETLTTLVLKGTVRTEKLTNILRSNEGLDTTFNCLIGMIRSDLLAFVP
nr:patatin phospholipase domain containing protein [Hymenolepis microstoma]